MTKGTHREAAASNTHPAIKQGNRERKVYPSLRSAAHLLELELDPLAVANVDTARGSIFEPLQRS